MCGFKESRVGTSNNYMCTCTGANSNQEKKDRVRREERVESCSNFLQMDLPLQTVCLQRSHTHLRSLPTVPYACGTELHYQIAFSRLRYTPSLEVQDDHVNMLHIHHSEWWTIPNRYIDAAVYQKSMFVNNYNFSHPIMCHSRYDS